MNNDNSLELISDEEICKCNDVPYLERRRAELEDMLKVRYRRKLTTQQHLDVLKKLCLISDVIVEIMQEEDRGKWWTGVIF